MTATRTLPLVLALALALSACTQQPADAPAADAATPAAAAVDAATPEAEDASAFGTAVDDAPIAAASGTAPTAAVPPPAGAPAPPAEASAPALPGPTGEDVAAAAQLSGDDRRAMIEGMVGQLAERLKTAPNDVEGWKRLLRSYSVLGEPERAQGALTEARAVFAEGSAERGAIEEFAAALGLSATGATP